MPNIIRIYKKLLNGAYLILNPQNWLYVIKHPRALIANVSAIAKHPRLCWITSQVSGGIGPAVGCLLYETALKTKNDSRPIVEVGAWKGLSTVYLGLAAHSINKRVKSFELFSGLPTADPLLDGGFRAGQFSSDVSEYENNLESCGITNSVDLTIGDARKTMLPSIHGQGFCMAFLDVDVHDVMSELFSQLWTISKGNEVIIVHDFHSPGIKKAIDDFSIETKHSIKVRSLFGGGTAKIILPSSTKNSPCSRALGR